MGWLVSSLTIINDRATAEKVVELPDRFIGKVFSKGLQACRRYQVSGTREKAQQGFSHIINSAQPMLRHSRKQGTVDLLAATLLFDKATVIQ